MIARDRGDRGFSRSRTTTRPSDLRRSSFGLLPLVWLSPDVCVASMVAASVLSCGVQLVVGNVVEPRLMGSSFELHPIVVLLALMIWYALWGFVWMLLSVPMTAALKVVLQRIERTKGIALLMEGQLTVLTMGEKSE